VNSGIHSETVIHISKIYFRHWEPLGVSESCRTRIPGWSNPRVYRTDAVSFRCTWERLGVPATSLGAPATSLGAPTTSGGDRQQAWEQLGAQATRLEAPTENLGATTTSLGARRITVEQAGKNIFGNAAGACLEIIATTHRLTTVKP
jgi:hypothetical protein